MDKGLRHCLRSIPRRSGSEVSILGLVDKGLRPIHSVCLLILTISVSILGLVDKGLRQLMTKSIVCLLFLVSILGLVDKGLRPVGKYLILSDLVSFNPWFSG